MAAHPSPASLHPRFKQMWPEFQSSFRSEIPWSQQARSRKTSVLCFFVLFLIATFTFRTEKVQNARKFPQNARKFPQTSANLKKVSLRSGSRTEFRIPYFFRNQISEIPKYCWFKPQKPSEFRIWLCAPCPLSWRVPLTFTEA